MVAVYGMTILYAPDAGRYYLGAAIVMAIAQLLTLSSFLASDREKLGVKTQADGVASEY